MYPWQYFTLGLIEHLIWPVIVFSCALIFKEDIRKILSRLTKLPGGAELTPAVLEEQKENKNKFDELFIESKQETEKQSASEGKEIK